MVRRALTLAIAAVGFVLFFVGFFGHGFQEANYVLGIHVGTSYPYRQYTFPLIVLGASLMAGALALELSSGVPLISRPSPQAQMEPRTDTYCPRCGERVPDCCLRCGEKIR